MFDTIVISEIARHDYRMEPLPREIDEVAP